MNDSTRFLSTVVLIISASLYGDPARGQNLQAIIPNPRTLTIDDVGWKLGVNESESNGPFRLGTNRNPVFKDYEVLTYVARAVGTRLSAKFILSEFDRENVLAGYPSTSEQGEAWDNSALTGSDDFLYMNYVKDNSAWIELGIHGVRHEHWNWVTRRGLMRRWEFFDRLNKQPWPYDHLVGHLECFKKILNQYGINTFPKSYTPPGNGYHYSANGGQDSGSLFSSFGVKYAMCNMEATREFGTPDAVIRAGGVIHSGLLWINEAGFSSDPNWPAYNAIGAVPQSHPDDGIPLTHWPNWWASNPDSNLFVGDKYIAWFNEVKQRPDWYVPKNIAQYFSQWLYRKYTTMTESSGSLIIDNSAMPLEAYTQDLLGNLLIKFPLAEGEHLSRATIDGGGEIAGYYEEFGYGHLLLSPLQKQVYLLHYEKGSTSLAEGVIHEGTYNVLAFRTAGETTTLRLEMYGAQDVKLRPAFVPTSVTSLDTGLVINSQTYNPVANEFVINISGKDIMGQRGEIFIQGVPFQKLTMISPISGEMLPAGSLKQITWASQGLIFAVSLELSIDRGSNWIVIADSTENDGAYDWLVPPLVSDSCLIRVSDAADGEPSDATDAVFSIVPSIDLISPNGGETLYAGSVVNVTWNTSGALALVRLEFSTNAGNSWTPITIASENDGSYSWSVPTVFSYYNLIRISDAADGEPWDVSDAVFSILPSPPTLVLTSPNGGETLQSGSSTTITWNTGGALALVKLELSSDSGNSWTMITPSTENDGGYPWTVPNVISDQNLLRISDSNDGDPADVTDAVFSIVPPPAVLTLTSPNGGESFFAGSAATITWSSSGALDFIRLEFSSDAGNTWSLITAATENDGTFVWTIPSLVSDHGLIRISDAIDNDPSDTSDSSFSIIDDTTEVLSSTPPKAFALHPSYPNPFKPSTRIRFDLPGAEQVKLVVYDIRGREVKVLISAFLPDGRHNALWDGTDSTGRRAGSGVYFYHLQAGLFEAIRRMTILQ
jgi:hypothetical protein